MLEFENAHDFERVIGMLFQRGGWQVEFPPENNKGYDIEALKGQDHLAIQVKNHKATIKVPQLEKFINYLELPVASRFNKAVFISASGFSHQALTFFSQLGRRNVFLGTYGQGGIKWVTNFNEIEPKPQGRQTTYIGVFTAKGGVGKTTISAHLAGAFALTGYDVALIDLDPQRNLSTLLGEGIFLPSVGKKPGSAVCVINHDEWDERLAADSKIVICDCSPAFDKNPIEIMRKLNYCIVPTTLNPLGLNKNGHVIVKTLEAIRSVNPEAYLFVLINNYFSDETRRTEVLKEQYRRFFADLATRDSKFYFIDPEEASIRNSKQLYYWGYHIYAGGKSELAFNPVGGRCYPKADFLNLIDYLETHSSIEEHKAPSNGSKG